MPHSHLENSQWALKKRDRKQLLCSCGGRYCPHCQRRKMWKDAYHDQERGEHVNVSQTFFIHPEIDINVGDVLIQSLKYVHAALSQPIHRYTPNPRKEEYWRELISTLPKMKLA